MILYGKINDCKRNLLSINQLIDGNLADFESAKYFVILSKFECMELTMTAPIAFTENAINEIKRLMAAPGFDTTEYLRVGVKGGGCSGMTYILGFDKKEENDEQFEFEGLSFIMNKAHGIYLMGMEVDWQDGLNARGFVFNNPNASKTCGCGTSFAV